MNVVRPHRLARAGALVLLGWLGNLTPLHAAPLPSAVDLRPAFTNWGLTLLPQGGRGTCSVFTLTGALEFARAKQSGQGVLLSVEFLNWAANDVQQQYADGGFFADLWRGFAAHGICPETNWPYAAKFAPGSRPDETARAQAGPAKAADLSLRWIKPWDVRTGITDEQFTALQRVLAAGWPICGGLRWPKAERWENGVLAMAASAEVFDGHSVLLVGFRDDAALPGGGAFLIRNSGGGEHDAALPYAYVRAYLNDAAWIAPTATAAPTLP